AGAPGGHRARTADVVPLHVGGRAGDEDLAVGGDQQARVLLGAAVGGLAGGDRVHHQVGDHRPGVVGRVEDLAGATLHGDAVAAQGEGAAVGQGDGDVVPARFDHRL